MAFPAKAYFFHLLASRKPTKQIHALPTANFHPRNAKLHLTQHHGACPSEHDGGGECMGWIEMNRMRDEG